MIDFTDVDERYHTILTLYFVKRLYKLADLTTAFNATRVSKAPLRQEQVSLLLKHAIRAWFVMLKIPDLPDVTTLSATERLVFIPLLTTYLEELCAASSLPSPISSSSSASGTSVS